MRCLNWEAFTRTGEAEAVRRASTAETGKTDIR
jgi:hypothetical protein